MGFYATLMKYARHTRELYVSPSDAYTIASQFHAGPHSYATIGVSHDPDYIGKFAGMEIRIDTDLVDSIFRPSDIEEFKREEESRRQKDPAQREVQDGPP